MKNMKKKLVATGAIVTTGYYTAANAALTVPALNTDDTVAVAGAVLAGFGIIWGVKRAIALMAR